MLSERPCHDITRGRVLRIVQICLIFNKFLCLYYYVPKEKKRSLNMSSGEMVKLDQTVVRVRKGKDS